MQPMPQPNGARQDSSDIEPLLAGYHCLFPRVFDEMLDHDGQVRPHWRPFLGMLAALGKDEVNRRFAAADRHLRDSGVFYRVYEDPEEAVRPWPLSHVPLLIDATEWQELQAGLIQRARLLEAILADIYGPADLIREGRLPAAVVAGNPEFLRPMVGVAPPGGTHLRFYGVDVGRSPSGRWWVLGDRTQAPSGAGFALENRLALSRAMPDIYGAMRVERVAPFFQAFQASLSALNRRDDLPVCVLTPGPLNETYFEHAYLARYLGFLLVEGEDLTVQHDGVFIRTVSGLKRAEVLLRRLDFDFADPLELSARSRLGVPGLVQAVRDGTVAMANSLGSGVVEAHSTLSFLPALAPAVLGEDLALPNIATWWLGDPSVRADVLNRFDNLVIASAFSGDIPAHIERHTVIGKDLDPKLRADLIEAIGRRGIDFVAQEAVTLSTTPVWNNGQLVPRPFILRLLLAKTDDGWRVMPGGFVRIADDLDARAVSRNRVAAPPTRGSCRTSRWSRHRCCRQPTASPSTAAPARYRAGRRPTCSGSAVMSSAPRRRCGSFARWSTAPRRPAMPRPSSMATSSACCVPGTRRPRTCSMPARRWLPPRRCSSAHCPVLCRR